MRKRRRRRRRDDSRFLLLFPQECRAYHGRTPALADTTGAARQTPKGAALRFGAGQSKLQPAPRATRDQLLPPQECRANRGRTPISADTTKAPPDGHPKAPPCPVALGPSQQAGEGAAQGGGGYMSILLTQTLKPTSP